MDQDRWSPYPDLSSGGGIALRPSRATLHLSRSVCNWMNPSFFRADQVDDRFIASDCGGMLGERGKVVAVARTERVTFVINAQFEHAADDPVRLIFGVGGRVV